MKKINCFNCGLSSRRERRYKISDLGKEIINRLTEWHPERELSEEAYICHECCLKMRRYIQRQSVQDSSRDIDNVKQEPTSDKEPMQLQSSETASHNSYDINKEVKWPPRNEVKLPDYRRTACSTAHCVYPGCSSKERLRVPKAMRVQILTKHKLYIPYSARVCSDHITLLYWDNNIIQQTEFLTTFRPEHIKDVLNLQK